METQNSDTIDIDTLKQYLNLGIKLIPVSAYDNKAFISKGNPRDFGTNDINEIQSLINGNGYRDGIGKGSKINLFRFYPIDYGLVVIDIDRHKNKDGEIEKNGLKNWLKIEAKLNLPQDCKIKSHTCCVCTPSNGYHLYFKLKLENEPKFTDDVEVLYTKAVNVAGSKKEGKVYRLVGSLDAIPTLPESLLKEMIVEKPPKREPQPTKLGRSPQNFSNGNKRLSDEEINAYKPYIGKYLAAKGFQINNIGKTNCPLPEHHTNGDKKPSAQVNQNFLHCYTSGGNYNIWDIAKKLNNNDFKAAIADVINTLGRI